MQNTFLGVLIAICGNSLIGSSFAVMKVAHMRNVEGGSYLKIPMWWAGTALMIAGELGNLVAYSLGEFVSDECFYLGEVASEGEMRSRRSCSRPFSVHGVEI